MSLNEREIKEELHAGYRSYLRAMECNFEVNKQLHLLTRDVCILLEGMSDIKPKVTVETISIPCVEKLAVIVFVLYEDTTKFMVVFEEDTLNVYQDKKFLTKPERLDLAYREFRKSSPYLPFETVDVLMALFRSFKGEEESLILPPCTVETAVHGDFREPAWAIQDDLEWENSYGH